MLLEKQWSKHQANYAQLEKSFKRSCICIEHIYEPNERLDAMETAKHKMHEIEDLLQRMKSDIRSLKPRQQCSKAVFNKEWNTYSKQYSQLKSEYIAKSAAKHRVFNMERQRLLHHDEIYDNLLLQSQKSLKLIAESEAIGNNVSNNLHSQGNKLDKINNELHEIRDISKRANTILKSLKSKVYSDRLMQLCIVMIELVIIAFLLWWKLKKDL